MIVESIFADSSLILSSQLKVTPLFVPYHGEYTETGGYRIEGPTKKTLFFSNIDKWHLWNRDVIVEIAKVDIAFLNATFFNNGEVGDCDMSEIPHLS